MADGLKGLKTIGLSDYPFISKLTKGKEDLYLRLKYLNYSNYSVKKNRKHVKIHKIE